MIWERIGRTVNVNGTTVTYALQNCGKRVLVQSRKMHIPHANGRAGTWDCARYYVLYHGEEVKKEFYRLLDAKEYAEKLFMEEEGNDTT